MATPDPSDWVTRAADDAVRHHERTGADGPVTCSSGISPSGPVHLGNLREFLMPHFVADELRRRGVPVRHLHVWDDYDRFRKVPRGVDPSYAERLVIAVAGEAQRAEERGERPALVCSPQLRPAVRKLTRAAAPRVPVLAYTELADQLQLDTIGVITGAHAVAA